jgi:Protein of unknown function (DUF3987)
MHAALARLRNMRFPTEDGVRTAIHVPLAPEAAEEFAAWWEARQWDIRDGYSPLIASAMNKLEGIALRIALTLEHLEWAWSGSNSPEPETVSLPSVMLAMQIVDKWAQPNLARIYGNAAVPADRRHAALIASWLLKNKPEVFNPREARLKGGWSGPKEAKEVDAAAEVLVDANWLTPAGVREGGTKGRARKDFIVNPRVYHEGR